MTYNTLNDWRRPGKMDLSTTFIERAKDLGNPIDRNDMRTL